MNKETFKNLERILTAFDNTYGGSINLERYIRQLWQTIAEEAKDEVFTALKYVGNQDLAKVITIIIKGAEAYTDSNKSTINFMSANDSISKAKAVLINDNYAYVNHDRIQNFNFRGVTVINSAVLQRLYALLNNVTGNSNASKKLERAYKLSLLNKETAVNYTLLYNLLQDDGLDQLVYELAKVVNR